MTPPKKKARPAPLKLKDLKPRQNPKGGQASPNVADQESISGDGKLRSLHEAYRSFSR